jgi:hypothetical protein
MRSLELTIGASRGGEQADEEGQQDEPDASNDEDDGHRLRRPSSMV